MTANNKCERELNVMNVREDKIGESRVSRLIGRDVSSVEKMKADNRAKFIVRNQSMCDMKGILKCSSRNLITPMTKQLNQPTVLSNFSNLTSSQIKNRQTMNNLSEES